MREGLRDPWIKDSVDGTLRKTNEMMWQSRSVKRRGGGYAARLDGKRERFFRRHGIENMIRAAKERKITTPATRTGKMMDFYNTTA